ncbi:hypothetical protein [Paenibacillus hubeiensis]|uniref:hypothetical protein n=1 Tax=Paenibacillus hubeiensis TaxID=3077330 RepID=UPI0031BB78CE
MSEVYEVQTVMPDTRLGLTGIESIKQNVQMIATLAQGQMTLDRSLGVNPDVLDVPENYGRLILPGALIEAIEAGEPRAQVTEIIFPEQDYENPEFFGRTPAIVRFIERSDTVNG